MGKDDQEKRTAGNGIAREAVAPGFGEKLNAWCMKAGIGNTDQKFNCFMHRVLDDDTFRFVGSCKNQFPDLHEFGMKNGGGKFNIHVEAWINGEKKGTNEIFYIDEVYNDLRKQKETQPPDRPAISSGMNDAAQIVALVDTLLRTTQEARKPSAELMQMARMMHTFTEENMRQNFKLIGQARRRLMESAMEGVDGDFEEIPTAPTDQINPMVDTIIGLIEQYAPMILGGGPAADGIVATAKKMLQNPQMQQIANDPAAMRKIVNAVNRKHGPEETRKLFAAIGFKL